MNPEILRRIEELRQELFSHDHTGQYKSIFVDNLLGAIPARVNVISATIADTGNTDVYLIAPITGNLISVDFSALDALAASDTKYITWFITNLGQAGAGTAAMLLAADVNTTKATGGSAIVANTKRELTLSSTPNNTQVQQGDRLLIRADETGTLANTVTHPVYCLRFA